MDLMSQDSSVVELEVCLMQIIFVVAFSVWSYGKKPEVRMEDKIKHVLVLVNK